MKQFSGTSKNVSEIILVDDDDEDKDEDEEEDVEVVFTNLNKSHVYRNLMCQKIAQEIELLQAMCKAPFPSEFSEFKEHAKRLGFSDDVVQSAYQRIMKKYVSKLASFPSNTAPVCRVRPISVAVSPVPAKPPVDSSQPLAASTPIASAAVPVALFLNKSVRDRNSPETGKEYSTNHINLIGTIELDTDDESCQSTNSNSSANTRLVSPLEIRCSQSVVESPSKNKVPIDKNNSRKRRRETDVCNFDLNEEGLLKNVSKELDEIQISFVNALSESAVSDQNQLSGKKKVSKEYSPKHKPSSKRHVSENSSQIVVIGDNQVVLASENKSEYTSDVMVSSNNCSKNKKSSTDVFSSSLDQQGLSKCRLKETDKTPDSLVSPSTQSYIDCLISGQYLFLGDKKTVTQKSSQKQKPLNKKVVPEDLKKQGGLAIAKSHVGVKAKVVRTKKIDKSPVDSKKRLSKTKKEMSEAEFKEFKAEQKRIKYEETQKIHLQTLQKVHDRLVDVLIPKYYNKNLNKKS